MLSYVGIYHHQISWIAFTMKRFSGQNLNFLWIENLEIHYVRSSSNLLGFGFDMVLNLFREVL